MKKYIKKAMLKFDGDLEILKNPSYIVIHHTGEIGWDVYKTHEYHKSLGWKRIGYNYFIEEDGRIIEGRGMHVGAHTKGLNNISIGICMSGNFDLNYPSEEQRKSLYRLCKIFMNKYSIPIDKVIGHREVEGVNKSCPGYNFDMNKFRESLSSTFHKMIKALITV